MTGRPALFFRGLLTPQESPAAVGYKEMFFAELGNASGAFALAPTLALALAFAPAPTTGTPVSPRDPAPVRPSARTQSQQRAVPIREDGEASARGAEEACARGEELSKQGDRRGALAALREAARLYKLAYVNVQLPPPPRSPDSATAFRSALASRLKEAPRCLELYAGLGGESDGLARGQLKALHAHALGVTGSDPAGVVYFMHETDERADINYRPPPAFPREARGAGALSAQVKVRVVLGAEGFARDILLLTDTPRAFAEASIEAAKAIRFKPAVKDGRRVSQFATLEYGFSIR